MDLISAVFLGIIQGFTEWLPISSSGHLVVAQEIFGLGATPEFDIIIMVGTTLALMIYLRDKITWILGGLLKKDPVAIRYAMMIVAAGVPTAVIGFLGKEFFKGLFTQPLAVSMCIVATGVFILAASQKRETEKTPGMKDAFLIGIAQGFAIAPGISRSGSTIGTGLLLGIKPRDAAEFSFLIGAPAMMIASLIEMDSAANLANLGVYPIVAGIAAAFISGYASIGFLMTMLRKKRLDVFGYYCIVAGIVFTLFFLSRGL